MASVDIVCHFHDAVLVRAAKLIIRKRGMVSGFYCIRSMLSRALDGHCQLNEITHTSRMLATGIDSWISNKTYMEHVTHLFVALSLRVVAVGQLSIERRHWIDVRRRPRFTAT